MRKKGGKSSLGGVFLIFGSSGEFKQDSKHLNSVPICVPSMSRDTQLDGIDPFFAADLPTYLTAANARCKGITNSPLSK
eukprot:scaffold7667_cov164-Skeletonema_menzelii.AAC.1